MGPPAWLRADFRPDRAALNGTELLWGVIPGTATTTSMGLCLVNYDRSDWQGVSGVGY